MFIDVPVCTANDTTTPADVVPGMLHSLYQQLGRWDKVAAQLSTPHRKFTKGQLNQIANGKRPAPDTVRAALGLAPSMKPAPVCAVCGEVHVVGWCVETEGAPRKPSKRKPIDEVAQAKRKRARVINRGRLQVFELIKAGISINIKRHTTAQADAVLLYIGDTIYCAVLQPDDIDTDDVLARALDCYARRDNLIPLDEFKELHEKETITTANTSGQTQ